MKCQWCEQEMSDGVGCTYCLVEFPDGYAPMEQIKYGEEVPYKSPLERKKREHMNVSLAAEGKPCHDCLCPPHTYHHPGCDAEQCPRCGWQLISCGCLDDEAEPDESEEDE